MGQIKIICVIAIMAIYGLNQVHGQDSLTTSESEEYRTELPTLSDANKPNLNLSNRTARVLKYPRAPAFTLRRRQPIQIRSRADHFPLRTQIRRVQNGVLPQNPQLRYGYDSLKSSKYIPSKGSSLPYSNSVKGTSLRQQLLGVHPNGVHLPALSQQYIQNFKASPTFNGKVVIHPVTANQKQPTQQQQQQQQPQQQQQQHQQDNSYPKYIKPQPQQQLGQQQPQQQQLQQQQSIASQQQTGVVQYPDFKQFPIPDQQQMQKYNEQHEKYLQQQKYLTPRDPLAYYQPQYPQQQHLQQPQQPQQQQQTYAVHQPPYVASAPPKPVAPQYNIQPSIPIHEVSGLSSSAAAATSTSSNGQSAYNVHTSVAAPANNAPPKMYSVYEENDMTELHNNDYQTMQYESLEKEAQEYLRFMNTNEYFLPKRDPNYKQIDEENDRRQQYNLKVQAPQYHPQQQSPQAAAVPYGQHQQLYESNYQPQQQSAQSSGQDQYQSQAQTHYGLHHGDTSAAASTAYNQPIQVSKLFYQDDSTYRGEPSTVLRTSYQTAYNSNQFVVSSQDAKAAKYHIPAPNSLIGSTQSPPIVNNIYSQVRQSPQSSRTPEPQRFEFTERDAMVGGISYTHAPQQQLRYKSVDIPITPKLPAVENSTPSTTSSLLSTTLRAQTYHNSVGSKPVVEVEDDPEDGDDMQPAGSNTYGRQPPQNKNKSTQHNGSSVSTTESPPNEQKDTEDYCERICAIVEDEHEEIVCGSDGYMYTSEAQMECYASCLHIDITIQGKGSCSAR